ncbi:MAG: cellulose biosynthesis cyclic di-GMP-binding regulatory protein BcsB, partial [Rhizobiaceae bacterium]|nr:cellulose biosynthesis cyclic di-GMP-binding regulatory protein BcsB [Rhizobiaceae bacterium]
MKSILVALAFILGASTTAHAQQVAPFDMSGERPKDSKPVVVPPVVLPVSPAQTTPVQTTPLQTTPIQTPAQTPIQTPVQIPVQTPVQTPARITVQTPVQATPVPTQTQTQTPVVVTPPVVVKQQPPAAAASAGNIRRYVVPFANFRLEGEYDRRSWSIYLTPEQAAASAKFNFAYQNSIVVAPEASKLTILLNNRSIGEQQIESSDNPTAVSFDVPRGLLQPGANLVTFEVTQRHRTDCTIQSTYELWSDIDPAQTFLSFAEKDAARLASTDAIRAIGVDQAGKTQFNLVVPALAQPGTTKPLLRLTQGLALLSGMP